ncbi:unnamed protein product [Urochloa humidicola]
MATPTTAALTMKLLVDTKSQRVLLAEAGKHVVDFLFSLLALPVATAVALVGTEDMVGSFGNLYASVDKLDATYVQPGAAKDALLRQTVAASPQASTITNSFLLRLPEPPSSAHGQKPNTLYRCTSSYNSGCRSYVACACGKPCPSCNCPMTTIANYLPPSGPVSSSGQAATQGAAQGFVQGVVKYTVTDSLTVTPMSAISSITLLNTFAVTDIAALQEKTVQIGYAEGLEILKASLRSKTVLTDVFLGKKAPAGA